MHERQPANAHSILALLSLVWSQTDTTLRMRVIGTVLLALVLAGLNSLSPVIYKTIVDHFAAGPSPTDTTIPLLLIAGYVALVAVGRICAELRWVTYGGFEQRVQRRLILLLYDHVHELSLRFHLERRTGGLQQIIFNGLLGYRFIVFNFLLIILPLAVSVLLIGAILATFYPLPFALVMLTMCTLYITSLLFGVGRQRELQRTGNLAFEEAYARTTDSYLNYETIKLFGADTVVRQRLNESLSQGQNSFVRFYLLRTLTGLAQSMWLLIWLAVTVVLAATYYVQGVMTLGDFVLVNTYTLQLWVPLEFLGLAYREIRMGQTNVERMLTLLGEKRDVTEPVNPISLPVGKKELRFDNVEFSYDRDHHVLKGISFVVPSGRTVAIVGPSGSGKSTIARLAFRFYDAGGGRISLGGVPIKDLSLNDLRSTIAVVPQDTVLFNETIAHNIGIARAKASQAEIEEAARFAEIHDFIMSRPQAYDTVVGERGLKLSGGQKQRIAIARAMLKRASLLIFDEATSALDSRTEQRIQRSLRTLSDGAATLIITHRLSTVLHADEILVLDGGVIVERGRHEELLSLDGVYAAMWRRQLQHPDVAEELDVAS
ncbi:ATP-binding cassette domain-containing protein [Bradyrhizobium sp. LHD-71]|uniref:ATP-binding cassette domain-containing protein n=1 Tax=Bradyrhizobium sp. LHD-71 TaxID=3072141 RepID=UPI00280CC0E6|nr:ATP-binding cassette domain-containing protein [Bradyrhizobium sp. LHD-71]MDQ8730594.1 ATP-binding cassette domain-containing protein [Bradyrhizobium sp. LHD-71]